MRATNSRLQRLEEQRSAKKAALLSILTLGIVVMAAIFGIPALVRLALFVGDLNSAAKPVDKSDTIAPVPPSLYSAYTATNSASLAVSGIAEPGSTVYVTNNGDPAGNVVAKEDGTFQFSNVSLKDGNNELKAVAVDQSSNSSSPSKAVNVYYSTKQPKLEVDTPTEGQRITGAETNIDVKGTTDPANKILVNDRMAVVNNEGKWAFRIGLANGDNTIVVVATDKAGNTARKEIKVNYVSQ